MRPFSQAGCLELWERGRQLHPLDRALLALSFGLPDAHPESFADWPLGRRNQALLDLYSCCFGPRLEAWTACAHCGEKMELDLDTMDLIALLAGDLTTLAFEPAPPVIVQDHAFRLPSSRDLASIAQENDPSTATLRLLDRCQVNEPLSPEQLFALKDEIEEALSSADPLAEMRLALACPTCAREWEEPLDVTKFLWAEIEAGARLLLRDIHTLASAYGWSESEILSLSEARRRLYLEMIEAMNERHTSLGALPSRSPQTAAEAFFLG
jgi:hypothetical protein